MAPATVAVMPMPTHIQARAGRSTVVQLGVIQLSRRGRVLRSGPANRAGFFGERAYASLHTGLQAILMYSLSDPESPRRFAAVPPLIKL